MENITEEIQPLELTTLYENIPPVIIVGLAVATGLLLLLLVLSSVRRARLNRAILETHKDVQAIKELLERQQRSPAYRDTRPAPEEVKNDPQLPPRP